MPELKKVAAIGAGIMGSGIAQKKAKTLVYKDPLALKLAQRLI